MRLRLILFVLALVVGCSAPAALAASPIEQVWSFNGGQVAIHAGPDGTLVGTVIRPTRLALCSHPVGEEMWSDIRPQPDGSYWGLHQWYFEASGCSPNPRLGLTAWRVMQSGGTRYLLVCLSEPGGPQPTIAPDGTTSGVTYGCRESARVAALPTQLAPASHAGQASFIASIGLPSSRRCYSRRSFQIHVKDPAYDPFRTLVVTLGGRRLRVSRAGDRFAATIDLKGLPRGTFTVRVTATTVLGHRLSGSRTYHTCRVAHARRMRPAPRHR